MKFNKKIRIIIVLMLLILFVMPLILVNIIEPHEFMGIMIMLFLGVNPLIAAIVSLLVWKDTKRLWMIPILFCIVFLLSYWIVLKSIIFDLIFYTGIYLIVRLVFMFISLFFDKKIK